MDQLLILKDLAVVFAVSLVVILVFHRVRLPPLPGFIVAGALVGPNGLRLITDAGGVESLAGVGVILLLFTIGIEFSLSRLREMGRQALAGGLVQMGLTIAVTAVAGLAVIGQWQVALFLGFLVALSSTAIVLKVLTDKGEIDAPHGRLATGMLIFQDLCVVPIMLVLPFLAGRASGGILGLGLAMGKAVLVVIGVVIAARTLVPRALQEILKTKSRELFLIAVILLGTLTALGTAAAGASLALGAFLAGLVISESDYAHQALAELLPFRDIFISLFFVTVGMLVQLDFIRAHPFITFGGVAVVLAGKSLSAAAGPALMGYSGRVALLAGLGVSQIGEFSFVLAKEGREAGLVTPGLYQAFLAVAVFTMLVTPFILQGGPYILDEIERFVPLDTLLPGFRPKSFASVPEPLTDHVIIAGYGLNGRNLAAALRSISAPYLIVELNSQNVRNARARGEPAFYGDATREEILKALGIERARMFVVAISDPAATRRMVRVARALSPGVHIIARTRYVVEMPELTRLGANVVIPEEFETSIEIFARVLAHYQVPRNDIDSLVDEIRASQYQALRSGAPARLTLSGVVGGIPQMVAERVRLVPGSPAVGQTLAQTELRTRTGALVLALNRGESDIATPDPRLRLATGDVLFVVGQPNQIRAARALLVGPGGSNQGKPDGGEEKPTV
ncbi:MAG TPA: cation:proton antiporter [Gemmatimonadales bacterium]|nr:cation:proton antiporter [Gemmatimonadales bacterium]